MVDLHLAGTLVVRVDDEDRAAARAVTGVLGPLRPAGGAAAPSVLRADSSRACVHLPDTDEVVVGAAHGGELIGAGVALAAARAGFLPIHASTAAFGDAATAICGPGGTGKTSALLALLGAGASIVAPEWILALDDGTIIGVPGHVRLRPHHVTRSRSARLGVSGGARLRLRMMAGALAAAAPLPKVGSAIRHRAHVDVLPATLGPVRPDARLKVVLMLGTAAVDEPIVRELDAVDAARTIVGLTRADIAPVMCTDQSTTMRVDALVGTAMVRRMAAHLALHGVRTVEITHDRHGPADALAQAIDRVLS